MTITTLTEMLYINFNQFGKFYIMFIIYSFSLIYTFYWKPYREEETPFWGKGFLRLFQTSFSKIMLWVSPFMLLFLDPSVGVWDFFSMFLVIAMPIFTIMLIITLIDFYYFGFNWSIKQMGMKIDDPRVKAGLEKINSRGRFE